MIDNRLGYLIQLMETAIKEEDVNIVELGVCESILAELKDAQTRIITAVNINPDDILVVMVDPSDIEVVGGLRAQFAEYGIDKVVFADFEMKFAAISHNGGDNSAANQESNKTTKMSNAIDKEKMLVEALEKIQSKLESWQGKNDAPHWKLGSIAKNALRKYKM